MTRPQSSAVTLVLLAIGVGLLLRHVAVAQSTQPTTTNPATVTISKEHQRAAEELLEAMRYEQIADRSMYEEIEQGIRQHPHTESMRDIMYEFARKHLSFASMKTELVGAFCEEFSESELRELADFYRTPVGQKWATTWPTLAKRAGAISKKHHDDYAQEYREAVLRRMKESPATNDSPR